MAKVQRGKPDAVTKILAAVNTPKHRSVSSRIDELPKEIQQALKSAIDAVATGKGNQSRLIDVMVEVGHPEITKDVIRAAVHRRKLELAAESHNE